MVDTHEIMILIESIFEASGFDSAKSAIESLKNTAEMTKEKVVAGMKKISDSVMNVKFSFRGLPTLMLSLMFFGWQLKRIFLGFLRSALNAYMQVTEGQTKVGKALLQAQAAWEFFKFSVIEALSPMIEYFTTLFVQIMDFINAHPLLMKFIAWGIVFAAVLGILLASVNAFGLGILGLTAAFGILSPILGSVIGLLTNPLALAIMGIIAAIALLYMAWQNNWFGIRDILTGVWNNYIKPALEAVWNFFTKTIPDALRTLWSWFKTAWDAIGNAVNWVWQNLIKPPLDAMIEFFKKIKSVWDATVGAIASAAKGVASTIAGAFGGLAGGVKKVVGFQEGGYVRAPTLGLLHPGETVLPAGVNPVNISFAPVYNISGVGSSDELQRILEEHDRRLMLEISRIKIPGV